MKSFIVLAVVFVASASAGLVGYAGYPGLGLGYAGYNGHFGYNGFPYAAAPVSSQYHAQDELGQYSYGYAGGPSAKAESRSADGVTRGGYSYIDANGIQQSVQYVSDPVNGFRVAATNLPVAPVAAPTPLAAALPIAPVHIAALPLPVQDTPEVAQAKIAHFAAHAAARAAVGA